MRLAELRARLRARTVVDERGALVESPVPDSTLATLVRRGLVVVEDAPEAFRMGGLHVPGKKQAHEHTLNGTQAEALGSMVRRWMPGGSSRTCCLA